MTKRLITIVGATIFFSENIKCVVGVTDHILPLTSGKMIFQIKLIHGVIHPVNSFPHMIGISISGNKVELRHVELVS